MVYLINREGQVSMERVTAYQMTILLLLCLVLLFGVSVIEIIVKLWVFVTFLACQDECFQRAIVLTMV